MIAPELLLTCPPPPSTSASPPPTLSCAPDCMLTVTLVLPGCATIAVVTGLGWLLLQVTVCPVVGFSVGVQAARAGPAPQGSAAAASATAEAVERKRICECRGALANCSAANQSDEDTDRAIVISDAGARETAKAIRRALANVSPRLWRRCGNGFPARLLCPWPLPKQHNLLFVTIDAVILTPFEARRDVDAGRRPRRYGTPLTRSTTTDILG